MKIKVSTPGEYNFSISQRDSRFFEEGTKYDYSPCRAMLVKTNDQGDLSTAKVIKFKDDLGRDTDLWVENLEEGTYLVYAEIDWINTMV